MDTPIPINLSTSILSPFIRIPTSISSLTLSLLVHTDYKGLRRRNIRIWFVYIFEFRPHALPGFVLSLSHNTYRVEVRQTIAAATNKSVDVVPTVHDGRSDGRIS